MLLRINITVIISRTNGPTQQCTRPDARRGRTDGDRKRTSRDKIRGATNTRDMALHRIVSEVPYLTRSD
jgi:hypothetical protein